MELLVVWIVVAIVGAIVAGNKGRSGVGWFFICLLLTPLAVLILLALPTLKSPEPRPLSSLWCPRRRPRWKLIRLAVRVPFALK
jgi:hypothetical protein